MTRKRPGIVYGIITRDPDSGRQLLGYVGQTRQQLDDRLRQHRESQPWGDLIVKAFVIDRGTWSDSVLDREEQRHIKQGVSVRGRGPARPLYNIDHNRDFEGRVFPWDAIADRKTREPGWEPPLRKQSRPARTPGRGRRRGRPGRAGWLVSALVLAGWVLWSTTPRLSGVAWLVNAAVLAGLPFAVAWVVPRLRAGRGGR